MRLLHQDRSQQCRFRCLSNASNSVISQPQLLLHPRTSGPLYQSHTVECPFPESITHFASQKKAEVPIQPDLETLSQPCCKVRKRRKQNASRERGSVVTD